MFIYCQTIVLKLTESIDQKKNLVKKRSFLGRQRCYFWLLLESSFVSVPWFETYRVDPPEEEPG